MNENLNMSGELKVTVIKGNKSKKKKYTNNISTELKNVIANSLQSAQTFSVGGSKFSTDNFASPTSGENGIVVFNGSNYLEQKMGTITTSTANNNIILNSSTRADGSSYSLQSAKCGHGWDGSSGFDFEYANVSFSQTVNDGQQLDLAWTIQVG